VVVFAMYEFGRSDFPFISFMDLKVIEAWSSIRNTNRDKKVPFATQTVDCFIEQVVCISTVYIFLEHVKKILNSVVTQ
jgi:hypothetical protein